MNVQHITSLKQSSHFARDLSDFDKFSESQSFCHQKRQSRGTWCDMITYGKLVAIKSILAAVILQCVTAKMTV